MAQAKPVWVPPRAALVSTMPVVRELAARRRHPRLFADTTPCIVAADRGALGLRSVAERTAETAGVTSDVANRHERLPRPVAESGPRA